MLMGFVIEDGVLLKYTPGLFPKPDIVIPDNVKKIGAKAFGMCANIKSIALPISVTEICSEAFKGCTLLETINLPGSIVKIGSEAFRNCSSLQEISIPVGVPEIREYTFCNCTSLKTISMHDSITKIELHSFYGCKSLESIKIPAGVTVISDFLFCGCSSLNEVILHEGIQKIGSSAFWGCSALSSITLPESLKEIDDVAFRDCPSLTKITLPDGIERIGKGAFSDCPKLQIILPEDYQHIRGSLVGYKVKQKRPADTQLPEKHISAEPGKAQSSKEQPSKTQSNSPRQGEPIKGFTQVVKPKYYNPGSMMTVKQIRGYDISNTQLVWERVPIWAIEQMIDTRDYDMDMYLPMKYSIVAAVFIKDRQPEAESYIWTNTVELISYFINANDYATVRALFESGKFITSRNIVPLWECAVDKVQSGGDMKLQLYINNFYLMNGTASQEYLLDENIQPTTREYLHMLDIIQTRIDDLRMLLSQGADASQIILGTNELFNEFLDFRASLPEEHARLFDEYDQWNVSNM